MHSKVVLTDADAGSQLGWRLLWGRWAPATFWEASGRAFRTGKEAVKACSVASTLVMRGHGGSARKSDLIMVYA